MSVGRGGASSKKATFSNHRLLRALLLLVPVIFAFFTGTDIEMFGGEKLTISCINCNSLNMSQSAKWNQTLKVCGITKLKSDIIFMSDIRLSNKNLVSLGDDIAKLFYNNPYGKYEFFHNSSLNKRGVGILIKSGLQIEIIEQRKTEDENLLLLRARILNTEVMLMCIYGPNVGDQNFFTNIRELLQYP
jgi:hypothetical protein